MTDPADRHLEERLHALASGVAVPVVASEHDVRRGRRRLLRMRAALAGGTTVALAAVVGITTLTAGAPRATEISPASHPSTGWPGTPSATTSTPSPADPETADPPGDRVGGARLPVGGPYAGVGSAASGRTPTPHRSPVHPGKTEAAGPGVVPDQHPTPPILGDPPATTPTDLPSEDPTSSPTVPADPTPTDPTTTSSTAGPTPGDGAAQAPPPLDSAAFAAAGVAALVTGDETFDQTAINPSPFVRGTWSVDGDSSALAWWARPIHSGGTLTCLPVYVRCFPVVVDTAGTTVHVGVLRRHGGWVVRYDGPSYSVRVWSSERTFPKKRAIGFVTQDTWQPVS